MASCYLKMAILFGIDEAGYGPILGPLIVSSVGISMPDELLKADLWELLSDAVSVSKKGLKGRLLITDSKKAYDRKKGYGHLQRTALALLPSRPDLLGELIDMLTENSLRKVQHYPWYQSIGQTKLDYSRDEIEIARNALIRAGKKHNISLLDAHAEILDAGAYNQLVEMSQNKSSVLFTLVCRNMAIAFQKYGRENLQFIVDRQGGRDHYAGVLAKMFQDMSVTVLKETEEHSSYHLKGNAGAFKVHFITKADLNYLPVSAASFISKYLRELLMDRINEYFRDKDSSIEPTAGYWTDGLRFISDIDRLLPDLNIDKSKFVRTR